MLKTCFLLITVSLTGCVTIAGNVTVKSPYGNSQIFLENDRIALVVRSGYGITNPSDTITRLPTIEENYDAPQN